MVTQTEDLLSLFLLASAPPELVAEVRAYLNDHPSTGANGVGLAADRNGHAGENVAPTFGPWELLHVTHCAPPAILDIAYCFWRRERELPAPPTPEPVMRFAPEPPPEPPMIDADERLAELATLANRTDGHDAPERRNGAGAWIETETGEQRYPITTEQLRIGAGPNYDVRVAGRGEIDVRIWPREGRYMLHVAAGDVVVDGDRIDWAVLDDNDILSIGDATFRFRHEATP